MGSYSIKDIEQLSGIKAHTIRIWEKRYQLLKPKRTSTNIRFYDDDDLKRIINISILNQNGLKISKLAQLNLADLQEKVIELSSNETSFDVHIDQMIVTMLDLDEVGFNNKISELVERYSFEETIVNIIYPFLDKIGLLWQINQIHPAHEHFISNLIRQHLITEIAKVPVPEKPKSTFLLFLAEHELHELGLLFHYYMLKKNGHKVIYLGQSVPYQDLLAIQEKYSIDNLLTAFVAKIEPKELTSYVAKLSSDFAQKSIMLIGYMTHQITSAAKNVQVIKDLKTLKERI